MPGAEAAVGLGEIVLPDRDAVLDGKAVEAVVRIVEEDRAVDLRPVRLRLRVRRGGVDREDLVGAVAEIAADTSLVILQLRLREHHEGGALLAVVAVQDRLFVVDAAAVGLVRRLGQGVAVDRHVVLRIRLAHQLFGRERPQLGDARRAVTRFELASALQRLVQRAEGVRRLDGGDGRALQDHAVEQARGQRRGAQRAHRRRARRLAGERHVVRIAAEGADIVPHPFERLDLVEQTVVARRAVGRFGDQLLVCEVAEHAQAVAHVDDDHALAREPQAAVIGVPGLSGLQRAAVDEDVHRQAADLAGGLPHVDVERILAHGRDIIVFERDLIVVIADDLRQRAVQRRIRRLHGLRREAVADQRAGPGHGILRLAPAQLAHGRLGVGDAREDLHRAVGADEALYLALLRQHDLRARGLLPLDRRDAFHRRLRQEQDAGKEDKQTQPAERTFSLSLRGAVQKDEDRRGERRQHKTPERVFAQFHQRQHQKQRQRKADPEAGSSFIHVSSSAFFLYYIARSPFPSIVPTCRSRGERDEFRGTQKAPSHEGAFLFLFFSSPSSDG